MPHQLCELSGNLSQATNLLSRCANDGERLQHGPACGPFFVRRYQPERTSLSSQSSRLPADSGRYVMPEHKPLDCDVEKLPRSNPLLPLATPQKFVPPVTASPLLDGSLFLYKIGPIRRDQSRRPVSDPVVTLQHHAWHLVGISEQLCHHLHRERWLPMHTRL